MKISQVAAALYTVRDFLKKSSQVAETLAAVRKIGYRAVEVAGLGPIDDAVLRKMLDREGLVCCSVHVDGETSLSHPGRIAGRLEVLGCRYAAYPFPREIDLGGLKEVRQFAARLNDAGKALRATGKVFVYHNHDVEFERVGSRLILDALFEATEPDCLAAEIDPYWVQAGGGNPVAWCRKLKGRLPLLHLKDYGVKAHGEPTFKEVGRGNLDWPAIIKAAEASKCRWFIVEQDSNWTEGDPFKSLKISFDFIKKNLCARD